MKSRKFRILVLFFLVFACLGYFREFFFVHLNNIMYMKYYHTDSHLVVPGIMKGFEGIEYTTLYYSKYFFTFLWTLIFFAANYIALKKLTTATLFTKLLLYAYVFMLGLAGLSMLYSYVFNGQWDKDEYTLSRWLMGLAQSPLPALILLASESLHQRSNIENDPEKRG